MKKRWTGRLQIAFKRMMESRSGATAIEYGVLISLLAIALMAALTNVGESIVAVFTRVIQTLQP